MLRSQIVLLVLMLGFLANWFAFLGVSIRNADSLPVECTLPADTGDCKAKLPSYYYDVMTGRLALSLYVLPWMISRQLANRKSLDPVESRLSIYDSAFSLQTPAESRTTFTLLYHFSEAFLC
ncbi:hypothetical protein lerEdw1_004462 [Lerista edwardsae]|nr:hypothetical protein lerEdw1_004462 [Lerista edwardsae]